jgi:predicted component of viral defense system (DUF524 family)
VIERRLTLRRARPGRGADARALASDDLLQGGPSIVRIDAEGDWFFEGPAEAIDAIEPALGGLCARVGANVLRVRFGNAVGVFRLPGAATLEVRSGKWGEEHFEWMLADLVRVASALPFAAGAPSPLPYDRSLAARDEVLYHAFVYLRHILSERAPREERLGPSLAAILHDPHRRFERAPRRVPLERAGDVDASSILEIFAGGVVPACGAASSLPLARDLGGHLPRTLRERAVVHDVDTPENRFVLAFLDTALAVVRAVEQARGAGEGPTSIDNRLAHECRSLRAAIEAWLARPLWREVGRMTFVPVASTVLQRRRGYRDVLRHFSRLRLATRHLPLSQHQTRDLLEGRDIARLYELWTYFAVVDAMTTLLGPPARASVHEVSPFQVDVRKGFTVAWPGGYEAIYNACFDRAAKRRSYSLRLFPDVTLALPGGRVHLLDAKFKLRWMDAREESAAGSRPESTSKEEDIYKMHAYRDAIADAQSAWILYPGSELRFFGTSGVSAERAEDLPPPPIAGVGAIPLVPGHEDRSALEQALSRLLFA